MEEIIKTPASTPIKHMNLSDYRKKAEHLSQPENFKQALKENWTIPTLGLVFLLSLWIRNIPNRGMKYLQALDPYMIFRISQHLALTGGLPALDFSRYFPYATPIYTLNLGDIVVPAVLYRNLGFSMFFPNYMEFAQFYPALMGAVGVVLIYFLGEELFDRFTGVSSAFFLAVLSGVMHRTSAGFFEKEPTGTALMLLSMLFFTKAWKQRNWAYGMVSGLALGVFTVTWGGAQMLWLLYPLAVGPVLFFNEDIRSLIAAYTPTVLVGGFSAAAFNPARFWLTESFFLVNLGLLALLWSRHLIGEFELLEQEQIKYYVPSATILGAVMVLLSPLYSQFIASRVVGIIGKVAAPKSGSVILGTVAESQPASLGSMTSSLGINAGAAIATVSDWFTSTLGMEGLISSLNVVLVPLGNLIAFLANFVNPWTLTILGVPIMATSLALMLGKKYSIIDEISGKEYYSYLQATAVAWLVTVTGFFLATPLQTPSLRIYSILAGGVSAGLLYTLVYYLKDEAYKIMLIVFGFLMISEVIAALNVVGSRNLTVVAYALLRSPWAVGMVLPTLAAFVALLFIYVSGDYRKPEIDFRWYMMLPFFWIVSNLLAAASSSRLVFLAGFPIALTAGYAFKVAYTRFREIDMPEMDLENPEYLQDVRLGLTVVMVGIMILMNALSGVAAAQGLGESPSQAWDPALNYMEEETPEGSVILSWWDYGYWFESIGRRAAIADGGNLGYYSDSGPVNYQLADFLTSSNPENHTDFLEKHSVDYIALDRSMIGKYSAVSQIARESNQNFSSMQTLTTPEPVNAYLQQPEDQRVVVFRSQRTGLTALAPIDVGGQRRNGTITNLSININEPVTLRSGAQSLKINCKLTDQGQVTLGNTSDARTIPYCVAERPAPTFEQAARSGSGAGLVMVPREISDSTLVRLYLMDGYNIDFVEKIQLNRFEYVKMWDVKDLE
jgi:asparagine N-glycosylation enzyme membrane subunit Stt3